RGRRWRGSCEKRWGRKLEGISGRDGLSLWRRFRRPRRESCSGSNCGKCRAGRINWSSRQGKKGLSVMAMNLANYVCGAWHAGGGAGEALVDPATGEELARVSSQGVDAKAALEFARNEGGPALRGMSYKQRAELLGKMAEVLAANRDEYFRISLLN